MAPKIFANIVIAVDVWRRQVSNEGVETIAVLLVITSRKTDGKVLFKTIPVKVDVSSNKALQRAGIEANQWIIELVKDQT